MEFDKMEIIAERPNKTIYRCGDYTVKVFAEDFSKADILNEALNTARVDLRALPNRFSIQVAYLQKIIFLFRHFRSHFASAH
ncbi:MAG: hypothetical protein IIY93_08670, partial [Clostridia bacterium]|nr:hypothetical protein [Clostridia bacterium]